MKYTLIAEDTWDGSKTTREFEVDALPEVLTEIEMFLRGAGFFFNGNLDFVNDFDEPEWHTEEFNTEALDEWTRVRREDAQAEGGDFHSKHYFDTERNK
jgi:hypothetical protein